MGIMRRVRRLVPGYGSGGDRGSVAPAARDEGATPPPLPAGWRTGPPDYIGIGVQKAGTTRWWKLIVAHPDVVGDALKETHHLSHLGWRPMFPADRQSYERYFPRPEGKLAGEWTPRYMNVPGLADTMEALAPEARLLVMLRDPVERYRSGVGHWQKLRSHRGMRPNLRAGRKDAFERSFYAFALRPYIEAFGRERLLVLQFEKSLVDAAGEYRRTTRFLGLPDWTPPGELLGERFNPSRARPSAAVLDEPPDLAARMEPDVAELLTIAPDIDLTLWPNFRHLAA